MYLSTTPYGLYDTRMLQVNPLRCLVPPLVIYTSAIHIHGKSIWEIQTNKQGYLTKPALQRLW